MSATEIITIINAFFVPIILLLLKNLNDKKVSKENLIHELQFNKEFQIYEELWGKLLNLKNLTYEFLNTPNGTEIKKEMLDQLDKIYNEVENTVKANKPFYHDSVFKPAVKILNISLREAFGIGPSSIKISKAKKEFNWKIIDRIYVELNKFMDEVEIAIRDRIKIM